MTKVKIVNSIITVAYEDENGEFKVKTLTTPSKYTFKTAKETFFKDEKCKILSIGYESVEYCVDTVELATFLDGQVKLTDCAPVQA